MANLEKLPELGHTTAKGASQWALYGLDVIFKIGKVEDGQTITSDEGRTKRLFALTANSRVRS